VAKMRFTTRGGFVLTRGCIFLFLRTIIMRKIKVGVFVIGIGT